MGKLEQKRVVSPNLSFLLPFVRCLSAMLPYTVLTIRHKAVGEYIFCGHIQCVVIEKFTSTTRFCLICNYVNKIIPALQSRCTKFRFEPLDIKHIRSRLQMVAEKEGYVLSKLYPSVRKRRKRLTIDHGSTAKCNQRTLADVINSPQHSHQMSWSVPRNLRRLWDARVVSRERLMHALRLK